MPTINVQIKNPSVTGVNVVTQVTAAFAAASYPIKVRVVNLSDQHDTFPIVEGVAIPPHNELTNDYTIAKKISLSSASDVLKLATNINRIALKHSESDVQFVIEEIAIGSTLDTWTMVYKQGLEWYGTGLTLENMPSAAAFGVGTGQITTAAYSIQFESNGVVYYKRGSSALLADRSSPALFGNGKWIVGDVDEYLCDGTRWKLSSIRPATYGLLKWSKALASQQLGVANAKIAFIGDSTEMGSLATGTAIGNRPLTVSDAVARSFVAQGISANVASTVGTSSYTVLADMLGYDTRWTAGAGWTLFQPAGGICIGNRFNNTTTDTALNFTPLDANGGAMVFDTIEILYEKYSTFANFTVGVDGGAAAFTSTQAGTGETAKATVSVPLLAHTVNIAKLTADAAKTLNIFSILCYNSAKKEVICYCMGRSGAAIHLLMQGPGWLTSLGEITLIAPHLSIINVSINDAVAGTDPVIYKTKLQTLITHCLQYGDVILRPGNPVSGYNITPYVQANYELAETNGINIIDIHSRVVSWASANTLGMMGDALHPNKYLYRDIGNAVFEMIRPH
ncbi:MAG: SGNH/GDSL hydrolase family protein [Methylococcaceae bacterium]|jgi:hypothetical protein